MVAETKEVVGMGVELVAVEKVLGDKVDMVDMGGMEVRVEVDETVKVEMEEVLGKDC